MTINKQYLKEFDKWNEYKKAYTKYINKLPVIKNIK